MCRDELTSRRMCLEICFLNLFRKIEDALKAMSAL